MIVPPSRSQPRVEVHVDEGRFPALPLHLGGNAAAVLMERVPARVRHPVRLVLGWRGGSATTLEARVRAVHPDGRLAQLDVHGVEGDWGAWLAYLGAALADPPHVA